MKSFQTFFEESKAKRCGPGKYWCYTDKKCKKIPKGYHVMGSGRLMKDSEHDDSNGDDAAGDTNTNTNGGNGSGSKSGNGGNGGGNGG